MKKLNRPDTPNCLSKYRHGRDNWKNVSCVDKQEIWLQLDEMQSRFCAYCECVLKVGNQHIEHFKKRGQFPTLTFAWGNMFGSCQNASRCGVFKDNKAGRFDPDGLIKPDEEDFSQFCSFVAATGKITINSRLNDAEAQKARETLRVFNLEGDPGLVGRRRAAALAIRHQVEALYEAVDDFEDEEWQSFLEEELQLVQGKEFQTALEHAWRYDF